MKIVFRVDSSLQIGSGHLMRCLTLAERLKKENGADVYFIMRDLSGNLIDFVKQKNFSIFKLPQVELDETLVGYAKWLTVTQEQDAAETIARIKVIDKPDVLIIDSYAIDMTWENMLRPYVQKIMVIDDLANRKHDCDILLDQNEYCNKDKRYEYLVPQHCRLLLGPQYAILREEFYEARKKMRVRDGKINNILVFFGGSDISNETMKALQAISMLERNDIKVNVIVGKSNPNQKEIEKFCYKNNNMYYFCQVENIAEFMNEADLAIGAGGVTTWERCFLALPSIVISVADNQEKILKYIHKEFSIINYIGKYNSTTVENIKKYLIMHLNNHAFLINMKKACIKFYEGGVKNDLYISIFK